MSYSYDDVYVLYAWRDNGRHLVLTQGEGYSGTLTNNDVVKAPRFQLRDERGVIAIPSSGNPTVQLAVTRPNNTEDLLSCVVEDSEKGIVYCPITKSLTNIAGEAKGEIRLTTNNSSLKFFGVDFYVHKGVSDEAAAQSSQFSALIQALRQVGIVISNSADGNTVNMDAVIQHNGTKPVASGIIYDYLQGNYRQISIAHEVDEVSYDDGGVYIDDATDIMKMYYVKNLNGAWVGILFNARTPGYNFAAQVKVDAYGNITTRVKTKESGEADYTWKNWTPVGTTRNIQNGAITEEKLATALANKINGKSDSADIYTRTQANNTFEKITNKKQSISTDRLTTDSESIWYPSIAAIKEFLFHNFYTQDEVDDLLNYIANNSDLTNKLDNEDDVIKSRHISTGAVTETKLATALANKINGKIDTASAVKYVNDESLDNCISSDTIYFVYTTSAGGVTGNHIVLCTSATNQRTQYLFAQEGGIQYRKQVKSGGVFGDWGSWTKLATTATTTQLSDAITALNTAVESLQQNAIMKARGAVIESYINDGAVTEDKLTTELSNKINGKINSSEAIKYQYTTSLDNCTSQDTIYKYYGYDMQGFTGNHLVLCLTTANSKTTQVLFSSKGLIQYRTKEYQGEYSEWKEVATTSQTTALSTSLLALRQRVTDLENTRITKTQGAVIEDYINNGAVTKAKLAPALKSELDNKIDSEEGVLFVSVQNANNCLSQNTLYVLQTEVEGHIQNTHTMIVAEDIDNRAQYRFSVEGGFEYRTQEGLVQEGNPWSEWKAFATSGALSDVATSLSENYYTITQIDNALNVINTAISNLNSTVEFKANKVSDIDSSTFVSTAEETQYPSVGAIKRLVNSQIYRKAEIDTQLGTHIHNAELWYGLPVTVGFDNYKIPVAVIEGNLINKSMISNNSITTLYIAANVTEVASDILDGSNIATIYVDMDYNDGAILLENVEGLENVDNVYYKDGNYNFNKYLAKALAYIRSLIVNLNSASQRIEAKADTATTYGISVVLDSSDWNNNLQSVDISSLYTVTQSTDIKINISDTVYSQLDSCGCESICVNAELVNDSYILKFEVEGRAPATNITIDLLLTEVVNLS